MSKVTIEKTVTKKKTKSNPPKEAVSETKTPEEVVETKEATKESDEAKVIKDTKKIRESSEKTVISEKAALEWRDIYESRQTGRILTDNIGGIEQHGDSLCLIIKKEDAKILIPAKDASLSEDLPPAHIKGMLGAKIDYVITAIDRQSCLATGSRRQAMQVRQRELVRYKVGDRVKGNIIAVGISLLVVEAFGIEKILRARDIDWGQIPDVRNFYSVGDECWMVIKELDFENNSIKFSIKDAGPDPYERIEEKFMLNWIYTGKVTGIPEYGIYCNLSKGIDCLCPHPGWTNMRLKIGDTVSVKIKHIDREKRHVRGLIDRMISRGT
ncbi:MAG: 30S ribosomal protein S1 [Ruminiclostridium sp.]|nr:30S ribosomal protein S1 [Ruminiclostridium sp.]